MASSVAAQARAPVRSRAAAAPQCAAAATTTPRPAGAAASRRPVRNNVAEAARRPTRSSRFPRGSITVCNAAGSKEPGSATGSGRWSSAVSSLATVMEPSVAESILDEVIFI